MGLPGFEPGSGGPKPPVIVAPASCPSYTIAPTVTGKKALFLKFITYL